MKRFTIELEYDYEGNAKDEYDAVAEVLAALYRGELELHFAVSNPDDESGKVEICTARGWKTVVV